MKFKHGDVIQRYLDVELISLGEIIGSDDFQYLIKWDNGSKHSVWHQSDIIDTICRINIKVPSNRKLKELLG